MLTCKGSVHLTDLLYFFPDGSGLFQHDPSPSHNARGLWKWFAEYDDDKSPNLNSVEPLRALFKQPVDRRVFIPLVQFQRIIEFVPRYIEAILSLW